MAVTRRTARPRFTLLVLILASLTLITMDVRGGGAIPGVRGRARDLFSPVQSAVSSATHPITDFFNGVFQYQQLKDDNARLRGQLAQLQAQQIQDQYLQQTNKDLSDLLKLDFVGDIPTVAARVIAGPESNFQLTIVIDRGSGAGILKGMPVVAGSGLVGRVIGVSAAQSTVLLLTDAAASVGVQLAPTAAVGVASGSGSGHNLAVTLFDPTAPVTVGSVAVTSGLAGSPYPRGIPVGKVGSAVPEVGVQARAVSLVPVVDIARLSYVDVLVWTPQAPGNVTPSPASTGGVSGPGATPSTTTPSTASSSRVPASTGPSSTAPSTTVGP
jgi:rod shape-determining protein MreC